MRLLKTRRRRAAFYYGTCPLFFAACWANGVEELPALAGACMAMVYYLVGWIDGKAGIEGVMEENAAPPTPGSI